MDEDDINKLQAELQYMKDPVDRYQLEDSLNTNGELRTETETEMVDSALMSKYDLGMRLQAHRRMDRMSLNAGEPYVESQDLKEKRKEYEQIGLEKLSGTMRYVVKALNYVTRRTPKKILEKDAKTVDGIRANQRQVISDNRSVIRSNQKQLGKVKASIVHYDQNISEAEDLMECIETKIGDVQSQIETLADVEGEQITPFLEEYSPKLQNRKRMTEQQRKTTLLQDMVDYKSQLQFDLTELAAEVSDYKRELDNAARTHSDLNTQIVKDNRLVSHASGKIHEYSMVEGSSNPAKAKQIDRRGLSSLVRDTHTVTVEVVQRRRKVKEYEETERAEIDAALEQSIDMELDYQFDIEEENDEICAETNEEKDQYFDEVRQRARAMVYK